MLPGTTLPWGVSLVLGGAFLGGILASKFKFPLIFGYFIGGVIISSFLSKFGLSREALSSLAEIGLALLMFTLGLEFSLNKIEKNQKSLGLGALFQVVLTVVLGMIIFRYFLGMDWQPALIISCAFALSSTAMVVKILQEKSLKESLPGGIMLIWLLVQDVVSLPLTGFLPLLLTKADEKQVIETIFNAGVILVFTLLCWWKIVPRLTDFVASFKTRELLLIFVLTLVFIFSLITFSLGYSFAMGAFLVGLILSRTNENHAIFSEIRPLRDVFLAIFFVSLGLSLNPGFVLANLGKILSISLIGLTLKFILISSALAFLGYHAKVILTVGFGLSQVGEFSFAFALNAFSKGLLNYSDYSLVVFVTLLTIVLTPGFFGLADFAYRKLSCWAAKLPTFYQRFFTYFDHYSILSELPFENHVVILGYGRVGKWVGNILDKEKVPYLVVEYNPHIVRELKLEGKRVVFGDPADRDVLDYAQVDKARVLVLAIPDALTQKIVVSHSRALNPKVEIICRSHVNEERSELKSLGVNFVIQPEFEAALSISHRILQSFGCEKEEVSRRLKEAKKEHERN